MVARLKRRDPSLAVISLIPEPAPGRTGSPSTCSPLAERLIEQLLARPAVAHLPRRARSCPPRVRGAGGTVALRCPEGHAVPAAARRGSADRWCRAAPTSPASARPRPPRRWCGSSATSSISCIDGGPRRGGQPSTLVDVSGPRPRLLRRGALDVTADLGDYEDVSRAGGQGVARGPATGLYDLTVVAATVSRIVGCWRAERSEEVRI